MTNRVDVAALRARYNAIKRDALSKTDYPWRVNDDPDGFVRVHQGYAFECRLIADTMRQPVAEFLVAMHNAAPALLDAADERDELRIVCPQCYGGGTYVPNYHTSNQVEADEGDPDACPNPRWSPNADAGDYSAHCGCPEVPCTLCDKGALLRVTAERDALRAENERLRGEAERLKAKQPSRADVRAAVCDHLETWARVLIDNDHPEAENVRHVFLLIRKSSLLARLVYGGEQLRTVRCPKHDGRWSGLPYDGNDCACGLTGWLPAALAAQEQR